MWQVPSFDLVFSSLLMSVQEHLKIGRDWLQKLSEMELRVPSSIQSTLNAAASDAATTRDEEQWVLKVPRVVCAGAIEVIDSLINMMDLADMVRVILLPPTLSLTRLTTEGGRYCERCRTATWPSI